MTQDQLRPIRLRAGMSLVKLSSLTGISQGRLSLIERGANVQIDTLERIVEALNHQVRIEPKP